MISVRCSLAQAILEPPSIGHEARASHHGLALAFGAWRPAPPSSPSSSCGAGAPRRDRLADRRREASLSSDFATAWSSRQAGAESQHDEPGCALPRLRRGQRLTSTTAVDRRLAVRLRARAEPPALRARCADAARRTSEQRGRDESLVVMPTAGVSAAGSARRPASGIIARPASTASRRSRRRANPRDVAIVFRRAARKTGCPQPGDNIHCANSCSEPGQSTRQSATPSFAGAARKSGDGRAPIAARCGDRSAPT